MELESDDGAIRIPIALAPKKTEVGRGARLACSDHTVSRRHASFQLDVPSQDNPEGKSLQGTQTPSVSFEVVGKNPILVIFRGGVKRIFRKSQVGELGTGDRISLSLKNPFFFFLRCNGAGGEVDRGVLDAVQRREKRTVERRKEKEEAKGTEAGRANVASVEGEEKRAGAGPGVKFQKLDLTHIDPVKEFGFLVRGHEFDHYRRKIRDIKNWNWFLHEPRDDSDEDEHPAGPKKKGRRMNKRKGEDNGDEDWTGESEDEKIVAAEASSARRAKYLTRSKDQKRQKPTSPSGEETEQRKGYDGRKKRRSEEADEEDGTLGGFIVENGEEEEEREEEEEEEFDEDDEEDD